MIFSIALPISTPIRDNILRNQAFWAALAVVTGLMTFSVMDALMKALSIALGTYNALIWRTLAAVLIASILYIWRPFKWPNKSALRVHIIRGSVTTIMSFAFFWGLARTPIAEAIAISFIAPLIALYLSAILLGEKIERKAILASLLGLSGVAIIIAAKIRGEFSADAQWGIAAILFSATLYAWNLVLQRQQALVANPIEIAAFQNSIVSIILLLFAPFFIKAPDIAYTPQIMAAAFCAVISSLFISWGYARAQAQSLVPLEYSIFIWACLLGWFYFDEAVTIETLLGTILIVTACLIATWTRKPKTKVPQSIPNLD